LTQAALQSALATSHGLSVRGCSARQAKPRFSSLVMTSFLDIPTLTPNRVSGFSAAMAAVADSEVDKTINRTSFKINPVRRADGRGPRTGRRPHAPPNHGRLVSIPPDHLNMNRASTRPGSNDNPSHPEDSHIQPMVWSVKLPLGWSIASDVGTRPAVPVEYSPFP
jgi:hypothetical protein